MKKQYLVTILANLAGETVAKAAVVVAKDVGQATDLVLAELTPQGYVMQEFEVQELQWGFYDPRKD